MATRPGVTVTTTAAAASQVPGEVLGTWFVAGVTQRGPAVPDVTAPLRSLADFTRIYGTRDATLAGCPTTYDAIDAFFRSGGAAAYVARVNGASAVLSAKTLVDRAGSPLSTLKVAAKGMGAWGNTHLTVSIANGVTSNTFVITILVDTVATETSPELASPTEAVTWSATSNYVTITDLASATSAPTNNPAVVTAQAFTSGADDIAAIVDADWTSALNTGFPSSFGPGMVTKAGISTASGHAGTVTHAAACNRIALLDGVNGASQATMTTLAGSVQSTASTSSEYAAMFAPWVKIPSANTGTSPRIVAPSSVVAGLISKQVTTGNANEAAAGDKGKATFVLDVVSTFTNTERDTLNGASPVNLLLRPYPASSNPPVTLYGYNTLASIASGSTNSAWRQLTSQLLRLQLVHELNVVGESFVFDQIDGRGQKIAEFKGALMGALHQHFDNGALYGATPAEAYQVDTASVNTPTTIAAGELHARVLVKISRHAEFVAIDVVSVPTSQPIAA